MTKEEYEYLQNKFSKKMKEKKYFNSPNRDNGYKEGLLVAKSILHELKPKDEE